MKTVTLQVPEVLLVQSGSSEAALTREAQWQLALRFFELGRLTSGQAAEMCSRPLVGGDEAERLFPC
jgi:hypothetical protein